MNISEEKKQNCAVIIGVNTVKTDICAAAARISTTNGTALTLYQKSIENPSNEKLIKAVLSSGHQSIMEHCYFNIAFNNVSVVVEQFMIEFRLASFTVQSRRYVDFRNVGFYTDGSLQNVLKQKYAVHMQNLFSAYGELLDIGIPKEDARFVLPYCFHSNFFCSCNARELLHIICSMVYGRGSVFSELLDIGKQLAQQFQNYFPDEIEKHKEEYTSEKKKANAWLMSMEKAMPFPEPQFVTSEVSLLANTTFDEKSVLQLATNNYVSTNVEKDLKETIFSNRARELEFLNISYVIKDISLSAITHFVRHRMQSVIVPCVNHVFLKNHYVLPASIEHHPGAKKLYFDVIKSNYACLKEMLSQGLPFSDAIYFALSGSTLDIISSMNARELVHFLSLRLCNRAQWEIRKIASGILEISKSLYPSIFSNVGPSCVIKGVCPEGNKTCGRLDREKINENTEKEDDIL